MTDQRLILVLLNLEKKSYHTMFNSAVMFKTLARQVGTQLFFHQKYMYIVDINVITVRDIKMCFNRKNCYNTCFKLPENF